MGAQMTRKMIMLAGLQTQRGTPAALTGANAMVVDADVDWQAQADKVARNIAMPTFSKMGDAIGAKWQTISFKHEACGNGLAGNGVPNPPLYDCFLQACGMARRMVHLLELEEAAAFTVGETISGGTSTTMGTVRHVQGAVVVVEAASGLAFQAGETVTGGTSTATAEVASAAKALEYLPTTARIENQKCSTLKFHKDGILKTLQDVRGTWSLDCPAGKIARFSFSMTGPWADPVDVVLPTPVMPDFDEAIFVAANVKLGSYVPTIVNLKVDLGNQVKPRYDANAAEGLVEHFISDRQVTGSLDPEMDALATFNPYQAWKTGTPSALRWQIGQVAGNRILGLISKLRKTDVKDRDRDGIGAYDCTFQALRDTAGDDEIRLYFF